MAARRKLQTPLEPDAQLEFNAIKQVAAMRPKEGASPTLAKSPWTGLQALACDDARLGAAARVAKEEYCLEQLTIMRSCWEFIKSGDIQSLQRINPDSDLNVEGPWKRKFAEVRAGQNDLSVEANLEAARTVVTKVATDTWGMLSAANSCLTRADDLLEAAR